VELIEAGIVAVARELNLELHLGGRHWQIAGRALGADTRPTPRTVRATPRQFALLDDLANFRAESLFIHEVMLAAATRARDRTLVLDPV
jgi:hypothetical protein